MIEQDNSESTRELQRSSDLTAIIVNYNTKDLLRTCLRSITESKSKKPISIYVVDNASSDSSCEVVKTEFPETVLIANHQNLGFAKACNMILQRLETDFALCLNSDIRLYDNTAQLMVDFMQSHKDAGAIGPKLVRPDGTFDVTSRFGEVTAASVMAKKFSLTRLLPRFKQTGKMNLNFLNENETMSVNAVVGASMMVRRDAALAAGLFDESFFLGAEDVDLCLRIKRCCNEDGTPFQVYYYPEAKAIHLGKQTRSKFPEISIRAQHRSAWLFYKKYEAEKHSPIFNALVKAGIETSQRFRLAIQPIKHLSQRKMHPPLL